MSKDYACWRITGKLVNSIEACPAGTLDDCIQLSSAETCPGGKEVMI
jgi:hypothetical protein